MKFALTMESASQLFTSGRANTEVWKHTNCHNSKILETLGSLKYEPLKPILAEYLFKNKENDYYTSKYAALGLLHFDCSEFQYEIQNEIEKFYGQNLFPEFFPALVCKLDNNEEILENLYNLGNEDASTDCNAGIILGFSLCGDLGSNYFQIALFNPNWEAGYSSTGTLHFTYQGLKYLNISFKELFQEVKNRESENEQSYALQTFLELLGKRIEDVETNPQESLVNLYNLFFSRTSENVVITLNELSEKFDKTEQVDELQKLIELKMEEEIILKNYFK